MAASLHVPGVLKAVGTLVARYNGTIYVVACYAYLLLLIRLASSDMQLPLYVIFIVASAPTSVVLLGLIYAVFSFVLKNEVFLVITGLTAHLVSPIGNVLLWRYITAALRRRRRS